MFSAIFENYNYAVVIILMMTGLYVVFSSRNLIKKLVGLSVFQTSVFLLYITIGKVAGGQPPIVAYDGHAALSEPVRLAAANARRTCQPRTLFKPFATCPYPDSDCGRGCDFGYWSGACCAYQ